MSDETAPKWASGDPQRWGTYWRACYQIDDAPAVIVDEYGRSEAGAIKAAEEALIAALEAIAKHKVKVEGSCWAVKHQHREQRRDFPASATKEFVTGDWYGRFTVISKPLADTEADR